MITNDEPNIIYHINQLKNSEMLSSSLRPKPFFQLDSSEAVQDSSQKGPHLGRRKAGEQKKQWFRPVCTA